MEYVDGGITSPKGFKASYTAAGIKYENRDDMALIVSDEPCAYAAVFTKNVVKAAPVRWDMDILEKGGDVRAVVINAGVANAATGHEGLINCVETADYGAKVLGIQKAQVLVSSTGVIGMQLPMDRIKAGIDSLATGLSDSPETGTRAAQAIMTTDTCEKQVCVTVNIADTKVTIGGMAKGSGMIHPNMGTMLAFFTTDANISRGMLQMALSESVEDSFNMVSVDGDTSTNDTCIVMANGQAGNKPITHPDVYFTLFKDALREAMIQMSMMIAGDGEGATSLLEVKVVNADTKDHARTLAKSVVSSSLTKAAIFGHDANWGRILCALGYAGCDFNPDTVDISAESSEGRVDMAVNGAPVDFSEELATRVFSAEKVTLICNMKNGESSAIAWGCDLSYDYVKINADYRS